MLNYCTSIKQKSNFTHFLDLLNSNFNHCLFHVTHVLHIEHRIPLTCGLFTYSLEFQFHIDIYVTCCIIIYINIVLCCLIKILFQG